jgi:hypothetical protein
VLSPGRWNLEAGPDFLGATLEVGRDRRRIAGDVEVHVHPSDWLQHGHGSDARYGAVVAHVTYFGGNAPLPGLPPGSVRVALREALRAAPSFSFDLIDVTAYPFAALPAHGTPCARRLAALSRESREALLVSAAHERWKQKAARMAGRIAEVGPGQTLYEEVLTALGYKHNRAAFLTLARRAPVASLAQEAGGDPFRACAALLGAAGLLPPDLPRDADAQTREGVRAMWDVWWRLPSPWRERSQPAIAWRTAGLRPHNHPRRRLAAAAALFADAPALLDRIMALPTSGASWFAEAAAAFDRDAALPDWTRRLSLGSPPSAAPAALAGPGRFASIAANVLVPFLAATGRDVSGLLPHVPAGDDNAVIRETALLLFGRDHNAALFRRGPLQQGLIQIFHDHCLNRRPGCEECRLAQTLSDAPPGA